MKMKNLVEDVAWKVTLKNPYTGLELVVGEKVNLHNNSNGKTYKNVLIQADESTGAYGVPIKKFYIMDGERKIYLTGEFMIFAPSKK